MTATRLGICLLGLLTSCRLGIDFPHDVDIPLTNDMPATSTTSIDATLAYPQAEVADISINDLNDSVLRVYTVPEGIDPYGALSGVPVETVSAGLGLKSLQLSFPGSVFGLFRGHFVVCDEQDGRCLIPYQITKTFTDPFSASPRESPYWRSYNPLDSVHVNLDYRGPSLRIVFEANDSTGVMSAGLVSRFCLTGDFSISIDFKLRDDMLDGFTVEFFVSPSQDTSRWIKQGGLKLTGNTVGTSSWVTVTTVVPGSQTRTDMSLYDGRMRIERAGEKMALLYQPLHPNPTPYGPDKIFSFQADSVYVHLRMKVDNCSRTRHCEWDNFCVKAGEVAFAP